MRHSGPVLAAIFTPALAMAQPTREVQIPTEVPTACVAQAMTRHTGVQPQIRAEQFGGTTYAFFNSFNGAGEAAVVQLTHNPERGGIYHRRMIISMAANNADLQRDHDVSTRAVWTWSVLADNPVYDRDDFARETGKAVPPETIRTMGIRFRAIRDDVNECLRPQQPLQQRAPG